MEGNIFGLPISHLKNVCLFEPWAEAEGVVGGCHYNLYLIHAIDKNSKSYHSMMNGAKITVELYDHLQGGYIELYQRLYLLQRDIQGLHHRKLTTNILYSLDLTPYKGREDLKVRVRFNNTHLYWKSGWYFEGIILKPDLSKG